MSATTPGAAGVQPSSTQLASRTLWVAAAGTLIALISFTTPVASLADTAKGLNAGPGAQAWILSSMSLGLAVALLTSGALADDFGRRRVFIIGATVLGIASIPCALAPNDVVLIIGRILEGVGAAAVIACSLALISHQFPTGPGRAKASGIWGAALGGGIAVGPLMAAGLGLAINWRAAYGLVAILSVALAFAGAHLLTESRAHHRRRIDWAGVILLSTGLGALIAGLTLARSGLARPSVLVLVIGGVLLLVAFVAAEIRSVSPMLDPKLFGNPAFVAVNVAALATGLGVIAQMSFFSTVLQRGMHESELVAAIALLGWSAFSVLTSLAARHLRMTGRVQFVLGLLVVALGQAAMGWQRTDSSVLQAVPGLIVAGIGTGVINAALGRESVATVPPARAGMGSGANNTARYLGSAIGVTIVAIMATSVHSGTPQQSLISGWNHAVVFTTIATTVGALLVLGCRPRAAPATTVAQSTLATRLSRTTR
ncbi:MFS family permease [Nakamurella sp. UYEF19]|uniref:MFS transporter n=1 Tax=Nakamurella sp. UYEF19 TaxID=1756392 RepID=UPI0033968ACD